MKITIPAQNIKVDQPTGVDPLWYEKLKQLADQVTALDAFIQNGAYREGTYTPVLTAPGGTVPTFTGQPLFGRYFRIGRVCFTRVAASNSAGGVAGSGSQQLSVSLPFPVAASALVGRINASMFSNSTTEGIAFLQGGAGATAGLLYKLGSASNQVALTCSDFNNVNRTINFAFYYPTD